LRVVPIRQSVIVSQHSFENHIENTHRRLSSLIRTGVWIGLAKMSVNERSSSSRGSQGVPA
jgi:hypothetical protein